MSIPPIFVPQEKPKIVIISDMETVDNLWIDKPLEIFIHFITVVKRGSSSLAVVKVHILLSKPEFAKLVNHLSHLNHLVFVALHSYRNISLFSNFQGKED